MFSERRADAPSKDKTNVLPTLVKTPVLADKHCLSFQILLLQKILFSATEGSTIGINTQKIYSHTTQQAQDFNIQFS